MANPYRPPVAKAPTPHPFFFQPVLLRRFQPMSQDSVTFFAADGTTALRLPLVNGTGRPNSTQRGRRAGSGPRYGRFGVPTHVDRRGREYRRSGPGQPNELLCRNPIRRRSVRQRRLGTPIGGSGAPPGAPGSRSGGQWLPRWPQPGDRLLLFDFRRQRLEAGRVQAVWAVPRSSTARIELVEPLYMASPGGSPLSDPRPYMAWLSRRSGGSGEDDDDDDEEDDAPDPRRRVAPRSFPATGNDPESF